MVETKQEMLLLEYNCSGYFGKWGINKWYIIILIPYYFISISSLIIAGRYISVPSCEDENSIILISKWLLINCITVLCVGITYILLFMIASCWLISTCAKGCLSHLAFLLITSSLIMTFVMNIVGTVQLFAFSAECKEVSPDLWGIMLTNVIFYWISLTQFCFCFTKDSKSCVNRMNES